MFKITSTKLICREDEKVIGEKWGTITPDIPHFFICEFSIAP